MCVLASLVAPFLCGSATVSAFCFCMLSGFGTRCLDQQSVPYRRGKVSHRLMRLEHGLEHVFVEALQLDLDVRFGLGHHCRRAAGASLSLGSAGGSSELPSMFLLLCDQACLPSRIRGSRSCPSLECYLQRLGCRTGWACRLAQIAGAGNGRCVKRACA